jgi:membrane protein implicated in regulation of membrane protease activity
MTVTAAFFYLFAGITVASAFLVIASRNPVHSVLFLILAFVNSAGLFILLGAEFLAMILIVVYVGAVAVLFLFVIMLLDIDFAELRQGALQYLPDRRGGRRDLPRRAGSRGDDLRGRAGDAEPARGRGGADGSHEHRAARLGALHALRLFLPARPASSCSSR